MSIMFAAPTPGSGRPGPGNLFEIKCGLARLEPGSTPETRKVVPQKTKGTLFIKQTPDQLVHFGWKNRESGNLELDLIVFPGDTEFVKVKECTDARMFMLKFKNSSDERRLFWLQEPSKDKDEEIVKKVSEALNNPPPLRTAAGGGETEAVASMEDLEALGFDPNNMENMDQEQLMQLLSLVQGNASFNYQLPEMEDGSVDEPSMFDDPLPGQVPINAFGHPADRSTPNIPKKKQSKIGVDQLRSIISNIQVPGAKSDEKKPPKKQPRIKADQLRSVLNSIQPSGTTSEAGTKEAGAQKRRPEDAAEIDAKINAEADSEQTTESSLDEPSAKKGKTDEDDNMELD